MQALDLPKVRVTLRRVRSKKRFKFLAPLTLPSKTIFSFLATAIGFLALTNSFLGFELVLSQ